MQNVKFQQGDLVNFRGVILEVRDAEDWSCGGCFGDGKASTCKKLPNCSGVTFRKLTPFEVRKVKKINTIIIDYESKNNK